MQLRESLAALPQREAAALQTERSRAFECFGVAIANVERRRHLVGVFCPESAGGEFHRAHHVGVDDAQSFLLAIAHQLWAIYFDAVDVDAVFVVRTAAHHILRAHLVL